MLIETRLNEILRLVEERKSITVLSLADELHASESTVRRDLTLLDSRGLLKKVHGGATSLDLGYTTKDYEVAFRENLNREEKIQIARYAAGLIKNDDFVFVDAGTTTELVIDYIEEKSAVFVTNGTVHAKKLAQRGFRVYILAGELKASTEAAVGSETLAGLDKYHFTVGFFGTNGVSVSKGFTTPEMNEAMVKQKAMEQCKERYVLCDSSKFNKISAIKFAEFKNATIITSKLADETYRQYKNIVEVGKL